jgi:hypothetical protein
MSIVSYACERRRRRRRRRRRIHSSTDSEPKCQ